MKNTKIYSVTLLLLFVVSFGFAQNLGEFKPSKQSYGKKNYKSANKRIYIASFNVNFEIYKEAIDYKRSGGFRNNVKGAATARAAIGLNGLEKNTIQEKVNQLYKEFVSKLENSGYTIVSPDKAKNAEVYEGWQYAEGPYVKESGMPGVITAIPEGYGFYYKREDKNGKKKKVFMEGQFKPQTLSKQLDDAIVADVELYLMYSEEGSDWLKGNAAKVKIFTNYRLISDYAVMAPKESGFRLKGSQSIDRISSSVTFTCGKGGLGAKAQYIGTLKKPLEIEGVIKKEKVVAYTPQSSATATSIVPIVTVGESFSKTTKWLEPDPQDYAMGLYNASSKFLDFHLNEFLSEIK